MKKVLAFAGGALTTNPQVKPQFFEFSPWGKGARTHGLEKALAPTGNVVKCFMR